MHLPYVEKLEKGGDHVDAALAVLSLCLLCKWQYVDVTEFYTRFFVVSQYPLMLLDVEDEKLFLSMWL